MMFENILPSKTLVSVWQSIKRYKTESCKLTDDRKTPAEFAPCICQGKVDTKNTIALEAQFGLVLNWAFVAQSGRRSLVIIVINILVQQFRHILGCR